MSVAYFLYVVLTHESMAPRGFYSSLSHANIACCHPRSRFLQRLALLHSTLLSCGGFFWCFFFLVSCNVIILGKEKKVSIFLLFSKIMQNPLYQNWVSTRDNQYIHDVEPNRKKVHVNIIRILYATFFMLPSSCF